MKKYKLIRTYPCSPKLGTIVTLNDIDTYQNLKNIYHDEYFGLQQKLVENYPEFWQKIIEKDYEVLSYSDNNNIFTIEDNSEILERLNFKIHSVKRLSDGEVFTIGDIVKCEDCKGKITSLEIYGNDIYLTGIDNQMPFGYTICKALDCFEIPQKVKQPLFTTEDGVDIFEGDKIFSIDRTKLIFKDIDRVIKSKYFERSSVYKYFSTKEKAEEYILMNKPCLSFNDIKTIFKKMNKINTNNLTELIKQKLKTN